MCAIDLEPCAVWREKLRTARRDYRCACCGGPIRAGERYLDHFSVFEGNATSERMCNACDRDADVFAAAHDGMRCTPNYLPTMLRECIDGVVGPLEGDDAQWAAMLEAMRARAAAPAAGA